MMNQNRKRKSPQTSNSAPPNLKISPRMDFEKLKSCSNLLNTLINHPVNFMFNEPVDPVKFQIPDYFIIICCPMDLGTVRQKLIEKNYENVGQFCDDVRLTFSNAIVFSRPGNRMHDMAKELKSIFEKGWKSLEDKWKPNLGQGNPNVEKMEEKRGKRAKFEDEARPSDDNREMRRAMLMKRFAGTILKAQEMILLNQGKRVDSAKLKLEREKLERAPLEAEARIRREEEARIEAAQKAVREKIEQERAAARLKLERMEKVVEIDDAELEKYSQLASNFNMEEIGLYKKYDEYYGTYEELEE